ncbi:dihydrouridine synthase [Chloropicon primus]|uniref:tRNA-dihydrouridine(16/17) synthase [NAD(P)(+)] n=1 Tax=Chloropicon primus TaxID=1764295 RepID=A0A5B8MXB2_9CHLO|nr:dihydrouridine synthase [Chloropicon primus]UPR04408.1 dihydrouridine synthase [Chloropicon primus]|eukprot:QDZ25203.1 dihydrouridine synthase [Chloropicon primus]
MNWNSLNQTRSHLRRTTTGAGAATTRLARSLGGLRLRRCDVRVTKTNCLSSLRGFSLACPNMTATTGGSVAAQPAGNNNKVRAVPLNERSGGGKNNKKRKVSATAIPHKYLKQEIPVIPKEESLATPERIAASWDFFRKMGSPKYHVAPMVDQSELPFRMLCRKYGATCAYTPMLHGRLFVEGEKYREEHFTTCPEDRPLLAQFCANDPQVLLQAAKYVEKDCDGVDLNFGCPQRIAKRGNYGAFLMEDMDTAKSLVTILAKNLSIPVTCKIRVFPQDEPNGKEKTLQYAKMLQDAGCMLLAVHGRTRDQKNTKEFRANWNIIKAVKEHLDIPVLANGDIRHLNDANKCIEFTGCEGVLSADPLLKNPTLFSTEKSEFGEPDCPWQNCLILQEYLDLCETYPTPQRMIRAHVHKLLGNYFSVFPDVRQRMNNEVSTIQLYRDVAEELIGLIKEHGLEANKPEEVKATA